MGFFDLLVEGRFKKAEDGTTLFFPRGWRKGYRIEDHELEKSLRMAYKRGFVIWFL
jgi:hypothetical protein